jgi:hypothetical protein
MCTTVETYFSSHKKGWKAFFFRNYEIIFNKSASREPFHHHRNVNFHPQFIPSIYSCGTFSECIPRRKLRRMSLDCEGDFSLQFLSLQFISWVNINHCINWLGKLFKIVTSNRLHTDRKGSSDKGRGHEEINLKSEFQSIINQSRTQICFPFDCSVNRNSFK